jgi:uncharacterized membrane protein YvbJ
MQCPACNTENANGAKFCSNCGKELDPDNTNNTFRVQKSSKNPGCLKVIGVILGVLVAIAIIASLSDTPSTVDTSSQSEQAMSTGMQSSQKRLPKVSVDNLSCKYDQFAVYVYGEVSNNTSSLLTYADFTATFYDSNGKILGTGIGNLANLPAHESKTVQIMALDIEPSRISNYKVDVGNTFFD